MAARNCDVRITIYLSGRAEPFVSGDSASHVLNLIRIVTRTTTKHRTIICITICSCSTGIRNWRAVDIRHVSQRIVRLIGILVKFPAWALGKCIACSYFIFCRVDELTITVRSWCT